MILAIDAGNTRVKWGWWESGRGAQMIWRSVGALAHDEIDRLVPAICGAVDVDGRPLAPERVIVACVAGVVARHAIAEAIARWPVSAEWIEPTASRAGVVNGYDEPQRLGSDRWAALIGAWGRYAAPCVVVNCGTATTIDRLDAGGRFVGGMIMPGLSLMKRSLQQNTARLGLTEGRYTEMPRNTADAIETGCIAAQLGAIQWARSRADTDARCVISGGAASVLAPHLAAADRCDFIEHLTLEGLIRMATE